MKNKTLAALLAFFFGFLGVHRFYLGQIGLGILYIFLPGISFILSFIDFISFLSMDEEVFDVKYNRDFIEVGHRMENHRPSFRRKSRFQAEQLKSYDDRNYREAPPKRQRTRRSNPRPSNAPRRSMKMTNPYKKSGIQKYKDFDYDGAINDFKKSLAIEEKDKATHFNIACAYSLNEEEESAFFHLGKAVEYGFTDFNRLQTHDALAYLRIQNGWQAFVKAGYRQNNDLDLPTETQRTDLLEQLRQLGELREKGLLTPEEFNAQKRKLLDP